VATARSGKPWRSALAYLRDAFGGRALSLPLPMFRHVSAKHVRAVNSMIAKGIQTVETSSCGRLFDAVSSLIGVRHETTYEGHATIELEMTAIDAPGAYPFDLDAGEPFQIDMRRAIEDIVGDFHRRRRARSQPDSISRWPKSSLNAANVFAQQMACAASV
jgi:hydrogenase maturation protein HypF